MRASVTISDVSSILHLSYPLSPPNSLPTLSTIPILNSSFGSWPGLCSWMWPWHCLWRCCLTLRTRKGTESAEEGNTRQQSLLEMPRMSQRVQILRGLRVLRAALLIVVRVRGHWGSSSYSSSFPSSFHPSIPHPSSWDWAQHRPGPTIAQCCTLPL